MRLVASLVDGRRVGDFTETEAGAAGGRRIDVAGLSPYAAVWWDGSAGGPEVAVGAPAGTERVAGPTPTATPDVDLVAEFPEVNQGIRDLRNSVHRVAGKRTFVRFHARSETGQFGTVARLWLGPDGASEVVEPPNPRSQIVVRPDPVRAGINHSFLLPSPRFRTGAVRLTAGPNPIASPVDARVSNKTLTATVRFEDVPRQHLVFREIGDSKRAVHFPADVQRPRMVGHMRRACLLRGARATLREEVLGRGLPTREQANNFPFSRRIVDLVSGPPVPADARLRDWHHLAPGLRPARAQRSRTPGVGCRQRLRRLVRRSQGGACLEPRPPRVLRCTRHWRWTRLLRRSCESCRPGSGRGAGSWPGPCSRTPETDAPLSLCVSRSSRSIAIPPADGERDPGGHAPLGPAIQDAPSHRGVHNHP